MLYVSGLGWSLGVRAVWVVWGESKDTSACEQVQAEEPFFSESKMLYSRCCRQVFPSNDIAWKNRPAGQAIGNALYLK